MKLVVINSYGPMGSTLLGGLVEKFGYSNVPLRKLRLHQYLTGQIALDSGVMQQRTIETILDNSRPARRGGVSVLDRADQPARALVDTARLGDRLDGLAGTRFQSIQDLYEACRQLYLDGVVYKTITSHPGWHIEYTVDLPAFEPEALYERYLAHFDEVRMIHLHRSFPSWINSMASQAIVHPRINDRLRFFIHHKISDFQRYEAAIARMPGLHLQFDDLFDQPVEALAGRIAEFLGQPMPAENLRRAKYDLYGKILPHDVAFKRFDDTVSYLSGGTLSYYSRLFQGGGVSVPQGVWAWLRYLADMNAFRRRLRGAKGVAA